MVTTIEVVPDLQFYNDGVFMSDQCQNWHLGHYRDYQWNELRPLRHAVVIIGFGFDPVTGLQFWKVNNSWGPLWGESGFFRILKGYGHCGICAYFAVAQCRQSLAGAKDQSPKRAQTHHQTFPKKRSSLARQHFLQAQSQYRESSPQTLPLI